MVKKRRFLLLAVGALFVGSGTRAAVIANYDPDTNRRFENDPAFIAGAFDLSGVATNSQGRWLTMISPNVFLSAYHWPPGNGTSVTFYQGNDPLGPSITTTLGTTSQRIGTSDLWIGTLSSPLPSGYASYTFATTLITDFASFNASPYAGADAWLFGKLPGSTQNSLEMAVGRNKLDAFYGSVTAAGTTDIALGTFVDTLGDPNFLDYELKFIIGDSGGPLFVEDNGDLVLVGINWFVDSTGPKDINGVSYVGNYTTEINDFLAVHSVPEPAHGAVVLATATIGFLVVRRRRGRRG